MRRLLFILTLFCLSPISFLQADEAIASAQQALKDGGFYYGEITGRKDADTTAAIRRYQIRNGLQITGELDAETQRSLGMSGARAKQRATPSRESPPDENSDLRDSAVPEDAMPVIPPPTGSYDRGRATYPPSAPGPRGLRPEVSRILDGTPYEVAPPDLQRRVIIGAQILLGRRGYYQSDIDGMYGPAMEFGLRAFQSRMRLPMSGRLDMQTLAALGLLPGQHIPAARQRLPRSYSKPVYRGEWMPN